MPTYLAVNGRCLFKICVLLLLMAPLSLLAGTFTNPQVAIIMSRASFYRHSQATQMSGHTVDCRNHVLREIKDELKEMKILKRSAPAA
jgi:hypothetical protein